jgi:hypothetical protein
VPGKHEVVMIKGLCIPTTFQVSMGRSGDGSGVTLVVKDKVSLVEVLRMDVSNEELGRLVGSQPVEISGVMWRSEKYGKKHECKNYVAAVQWPDEKHPWEKILDGVAEKLLKDDPSWELQREEFNTHKITRSHPNKGWQAKKGQKKDMTPGHWYQFTLRRWVDDQPQETGAEKQDEREDLGAGRRSADAAHLWRRRS